VRPDLIAAKSGKANGHGASIAGPRISGQKAALTSWKIINA
jgi:hypothetical protein